MDRSYLSRKVVVDASRNFVCIRLMTYENKEEAKVLERIWGHGKVHNTVFAILSPQGKQLTRGLRSPQHLFRNPVALAQYMDKLSRYYRAKNDSDSKEFPAVESLRLGLNVAACDSLPLAIVVGNSKSQRSALEAKIADLSWSNQFIGKLTYTSCTPNEVQKRLGISYNNGYLFVMPNQFGNKATTIAYLNQNASSEELRQALQKSILQPPPRHMPHQLHVREGKRLGISWKSELPITDPQAARAARYYR